MQKDEVLIELADKMTLNAIHISCEKAEEEYAIQSLIKNDKLIENKPVTDIGRHRTILIIGAGASKNANKNLYSATEAAKKIFNGLNKKFKLNSKKNNKTILEKELEFLGSVYQLNEEEFETKLLACSRFDKEFVLKKLEHLYGYKHIISEAYEIIGHLFKHRFIDVIINFNFDEILDNVIEEEMTGSDYWRIFSDGDCPEKYSDFLVSERLRLPIYIKPHGTISHPSSLKFNKEHYYNLPSKILNTITDILEANVSEKNAPCLPLNFIIAGFGMQSFEFNKTLEKALLNRSKKNRDSKQSFYIFDTALEESYYEKCRSMSHPINQYKKDTVYFNLCPDENHTLNTIFREIWKKIENNFKLDTVRGIERHLLISNLFQRINKPALRWSDSKSSTIQEILKYLRSRIYTEVAILIVKSDGIINITQIKESRAGKYFTLLLKFVKDNRNKVNSELCENDIFQFVEYFDFNYYKGFVKDTFISNRIVDEMKKHNDVRFQYVSKLLVEKLNDIDFVSSTESVEESFRILRQAKPLEIASNFKEYKISKFKSVEDEQYLFTDLRMTHKRRYFFSDEGLKEWNVVLGISETPWLLQKKHYADAIKSNRKIVGLVLSKIEKSIDKYSGISLLADFIKPKKETEIRRLPWWLHNQHLTLFLKCCTEENTAIVENFVGGIYYQRRMMSKKVNPIFLSSQQDGEELMDIFINYWARAKYYNEADETNKNFLNEKDFKKSKGEFFQLINFQLKS